MAYRDSSTFLKGTQSANPHNDYCQHFVDTGQRPQNFIRDVGIQDRFEEYPKLKVSPTNDFSRESICRFGARDLSSVGPESKL